jgi:hypothetical protein
MYEAQRAQVQGNKGKGNKWQVSKGQARLINSGSTPMTTAR